MRNLPVPAASTNGNIETMVGGDVAYLGSDSGEHAYNHAFVLNCFNDLASDMEVECANHAEEFRLTADARGPTF